MLPARTGACRWTTGGASVRWRPRGVTSPGPGRLATQQNRIPTRRGTLPSAQRSRRPRRPRCRPRRALLRAVARAQTRSIARGSTAPRVAASPAQRGAATPAAGPCRAQPRRRDGRTRPTSRPCDRASPPMARIVARGSAARAGTQTAAVAMMMGPRIWRGETVTPAPSRPGWQTNGAARLMHHGFGCGVPQPPPERPRCRDR
jgi:hypothetical protein